MTRFSGREPEKRKNAREAGRDPFLVQLRHMRPKQIEAFVSARFASLTDEEKEMIAALAKAVALMMREEK